MRYFIFLGLAAALVGFPAAMASENPSEEDCLVRLSFETEDDAGDWRALNDGVMGGRSSGEPIFEGDYMRFEGVINTNGGGFSSVRTFTAPGVLATSEGFKMMVKSDGRAYKVSLRTDVTYRGRQVAFQAPIPNVKTGDWAEVFVPFSDLQASLFGRPVSGAQFDSAAVQEMGVILADGQDGPFRLDMKWIKGCPAP